MIDVKVDDRGVRLALSAVAAGVTHLGSAWQATGDAALEAAEPYVPVLSGQLLNDLKVEATDDGVEIVVDGPAAAYAGVQSFGWAAHNIDPSGFLEIAADATEDVVVDEISAGISDLIHRVGLG
jgi:hypothetical protein